MSGFSRKDDVNSYHQICAEWDAFEKEFVPNNLALRRLFELCFFVGAASSMRRIDEDTHMRITTALTLIDYDRIEYMKKEWEKL